MRRHEPCGDTSHADHVPQPRGVLPARDGGLRAQIDPAVGETTAGKLERRVGAQAVEIVGVLVPARDGEDPRPQDVRQGMDGAGRITWVRDHGRELLGDAQPTLGGCQEHHPAIGADASAVKGSNDLLAGHGWKGKGQQRIVRHGRCGGLETGRRAGFATKILPPRQALTLHPPAQNSCPS
jgi:hypothetical protein